MYMPIQPEWLERLNLLSRIGRDLILSPESAADHPHSHIIADAFNAGVSGVFCVDGLPSAGFVCLHESSLSNRKYLLNLYQVLWNQGELDFIIFLHNDLVEIHSLRASPDQWQTGMKAGGGELSPTFVKALRVIENATEIGSIIHEIESGRIYTDNISAFSIDARVDTTLINDLIGVRLLLISEEGYANNPNDAPQNVITNIHDVLLQAIFIQYLNDRGIIGNSYICSNCKNTTDTLHYLLKTSPKKFTKLLKNLNMDFNGGLFSFNPLWERHSATLASFLEGLFNFANGQLRLLRLYRFDHIPVELLSEIYDRFLHAEGYKEDHGAYYTPRRLAALVVEQIWDDIKTSLDSGFIPRILDPACGSGVFLVSLFQRIAGYLKDPSWENLKCLATRLNGLDINETAIRISAFSISLALLNRREPKELQRHIENEGKILPELLGISLRKCSYFDFNTKRKYDCIIGNPPWGEPKESQKSDGEKWVAERLLPSPPQRERAWPFIWKSLEHLTLNGVLALLLPSTGFFLNDVSKSLPKLVQHIQFNKLIDLSDLRWVLFKKSIFPACILCANKIKNSTIHNFTYVSPKADLNATRGDRIIISNDDIHQISTQLFVNNPISATQRLMWTSPLERKLLSYLDTLPTMQDFPLLGAHQIRKKYPGNEHPDWGVGLGFQAHINPNEKFDEISNIQSMPYVTTKNIGNWVHPESLRTDTTLGPQKVRRKNFSEGFTAPHIVIPRSTTQSRLKASYAEHDFCFNDSFISITVPDSDEGRNVGKFLTAYLNSSFVAWYTGTIGLAVNRPRFTPTDILPIPFPQPDDLFDPIRAHQHRNEVVARMDDLLHQAKMRQHKTLIPDDQFPSEKDIECIDRLIFSYLGLRPEEIDTINESNTLLRKASQPRRGSKIPKLWEPSDNHHWITYCRGLEKAMSLYMHKDMCIATSVRAYSKDLVLIEVTRRRIHQAAPPPKL